MHRALDIAPEPAALPVALIAARPNFDWADHDELMRVTLDGMLHGLVID